VTVGDLDFKLSISGTEKIKDELEEISDRIQRLGAKAAALDGKDVDIEANIDRDGSLSETLETVRKMEGFEFDAGGASEFDPGLSDIEETSENIKNNLVDLEATDFGTERRLELDPEVDTASIRRQVKTALEAADFEADVDASLVGSRLAGGFDGGDVDRDSRSRLGRISSALQGQSLAEDLSRLNDEAFAVASILSKLPSVLSASAGGFAALAIGAAAAVAAVGGLTAAATALATKFGDAGLRQSLTNLQVVFEGVARDFVQSFQNAGIFQDQLFPAARELARVIREQIPTLTAFTKENLPTLIDGAIFLAQGFDDLAHILDDALALFDILIESLELLVQALPALVSEGVDRLGLDELAPGAFKTDFFREGLRESLNSIQDSINPTPVNKAVQGPRTGGGAKAREGVVPFSGVPAKATQKLRELQRQIDVARLKEKKLATFTEQDLQESLVSSYQKGVDKLLAVKEQTGRLPAATDDWIKKLERAQQKLTQLEEGKTIPESIKRLERATEIPTAAELQPRVQPDAPAPTDTSLSQLQGLAKSADSISQINTLIQQARQQFDLLANQEAQQFVGRLQKARAELKKMKGVAVDLSLDGFNRTLREAIRNAASLGQKLADSVLGGVDQLSQGIGQSIGDALFADQDRLNRLRQRRRQIQQNLRQARQAGNVQQIRQLSTELDRVNQKLEQSETLAGRLGQAFKNFGRVAKQALESFVSEVVAAIAKIAALKLISSFLGGPLGATEAIGTGVTTGIDLASAATGGFVEEGGLARIHEGEHIIPKGGMGAGRLDAGTASLRGDTIEIPVRMINDGNRIGSRNKGRAGRA
jgi:hypothetical protein